jgi:hypothetical protein
MARAGVFDRCASGSCAFAARLRFRPVRPVPSAWHEMPGHGSPRVRRPAVAVLSRNLPCDGSYAWRTALRRRCGCEPVRVDRKQRRAALRCEAKNWPYRPEGAFVPVSRDCIPGWWTWPYRPQSHGWRRVCKTCASTLFADEGAIAVRGRECFRPLRFRFLCICGPVAFSACKASSISLA